MRAFAGRARGALEGTLHCAIDFLIEDRCVLCGKPGEDSGDAIEDPRLQALVEPVSVRYLGPLSVRNRPVCRRCLGGFERAQRAGTLARVIAPGMLETAAGERFAAAVIPPDTAVAALPGSPAAVPVYSPFMTNDPVLGLVHRFKFSRYVELADLLGGAMAAAFRLHGPPGDRLVVAMPMSRGDRRRRGFNAAQLLARPVTAACGYARGPTALAKVRRTARQSLTVHERRADNVRGAFRARPKDVARRQVLLVDDLVTSGATAASAAAALLAAGAVSVEVLCFARAL